MHLSTADLRNYRTEFHETWWSYRYMFLVDPKAFRFVVKGVKAIFLKYNELVSDTTLLYVRNICISFYFLYIMNWDRTLHYYLSRIFTFYFISYINWYRTLHYCLSGILHFILFLKWIGIGHYTIVCQEYLHYILFLRYSE
jgi:hypothetical protein